MWRTEADESPWEEGEREAVMLREYHPRWWRGGGETEWGTFGTSILPGDWFGLGNSPPLLE